MGPRRLVVAAVRRCAARPGAVHRVRAPPDAVDPSRSSSPPACPARWGSTVGPDGALYVSEPSAGEVSRIDPRTGATTTFASGLPTSARTAAARTTSRSCGGTAYVLVGVHHAEAGGAPATSTASTAMDGPSASTLVADIGTFATDEPADHRLLHRDRGAVRARAVRGRLPRHRRPPQPRLPGGARRLGVRPDRVRQHRARRVSTSSGPGSTWREAGPLPHLAAGRQDRRVRQALDHGDRGRRGRTAAWSTSRRAAGTPSTRSRRAIWPLGGRGGLSGGAGHRSAARGRAARRAPGRRRRSRTSRSRSRSSAARPTSSRSVARSGRSISTGGTATTDRAVEGSGDAARPLRRALTGVRSGCTISSAAR